MQRHDTVLAFSCLLTTQCSITSAVGGGIWLRIGAIAGAAGWGDAAGFCFAAQPARSRSQDESKKMGQTFLIADTEQSTCTNITLAARPDL
jgi:hypothetical protein